MPSPLSRTANAHVWSSARARRLDRDNPVRLGLVAILDAVRQQVDDHQLQPAGVDDQRRQVIGDFDADAARGRHLAELPRHLRGDAADLDPLLMRPVAAD